MYISKLKIRIFIMTTVHNKSEAYVNMQKNFELQDVIERS